ncbi:LL-diaminopimelate aminotransferase [Virgibacillus salarius]|uniref:aminotransferase class I/II-fold pyridoxal phosphate-dependent enzyme n=1 Tax=Virgibacillus salarius TaxID=447199 RepID=UPI0003FD88A7|nr:aminotransferase class I/II-fold pyridoxal phosphate-dependent enzyme [Priestia megaterium]
MAFISDKVESLPPYLFSEFQKKKEQLLAKGVDVIDLGIGAPDLPTPEFICKVLAEEVMHTENHRYSTYSGCREFKEAVAEFYLKRYRVSLDPDSEVLALIGSKEGIANLIQAVINPGDKVIVPDPGYPVYRNGVHLAGGESVSLLLDKENNYIPMYSSLTKKDALEAKLMFLNYPSNPTATVADISTYLEAITFCHDHQIVLANDAAYDLVTFGDHRAPSVLQVPDAKDYAVELGSLSKSFNMTGWRIGYVVGNRKIIKALSTLKSNIDTCQFIPIQKAAAAALRGDFSTVQENNMIYKHRMEKLYNALREVGISAAKPKGTIFIWAEVPDGYTSLEFANQLLDEVGLIVTPGTAFGTQGVGFIRITLSVSSKRLDEVISRLKQLNWKG